MKSENPPTTTDVADDFTALWLAGEFRAAGEKHWAEDVVSFAPCLSVDAAHADCRGIDAVRARNQHWLTTHAIEDLDMDGPFVTGDQFALFMDMLIMHAGRRIPHSQIAVFAVRDGKIIEERFFYR